MSALQYVMAGVGALALLAGILILAKRLRTMVSGCKADAIVVDEKVEISRGKNGKEIRLSQPIFEFQHEGKTYRCQSTIGSTSGPRRGAKIKVRYLPQDPARSAAQAARRDPGGRSSIERRRSWLTVGSLASSNASARRSSARKPRSFGGASMSTPAS